MDTDGDKKLKASSSTKNELDLAFFDSQQDIATFEKCVVKSESCGNNRSNSFTGIESNDYKFKLDLSDRTGSSPLHQCTYTESKKVAFAEIGSDKLHPRWTNSTPLENRTYEDYNGNESSDKFPRAPTPRSSSESSLFKNCFEDFDTTYSTSSILDNEFDEPFKEMPAEHLSELDENFAQIVETCSSVIIKNPVDELTDPNDNVLEIITEISTGQNIEDVETDPNLVPSDSVGGNETIRKDVPDTILIIPESTAQIPLEPLAGGSINTKSESKDVPDTIIPIPPSLVHIPDRSLGRRNFQSDLADIRRIYNPVNMTVIENSPPVVVREIVTEVTTENSSDKNNNLSENPIASHAEIDESSVINHAENAPANTTITKKTDKNPTYIQTTTATTGPIVINEFSLISTDGNVLNSQASRHLVSQFGKFVAQELITQNRVRSEEREKEKLTNSQKPTDKNSNVSFSHDDPLKNGSDNLVNVSKYENNSRTSESKNQDGEMNIPKILTGEIVSCRYMLSGCKEKLEKGSMHEQDHYLSCKYRPIKCLLAPACNEVLCHHNYIPHLMQHFMVPTYSKEMISTVILTPEDFNRGQTWTPKWFSAYDSHFFAVISRKENGTWTSWVWMLGTTDEARNFAVRITLYKRLKEVSQVFPVHSIRTEQEDIEAERTCLLVSDETMLELAQVGKNMFSDFSMRVVLIPNAKELNNTIRENRALPPPRSRPLRSEKLYVTTIDALE